MMRCVAVKSVDDVHSLANQVGVISNVTLTSQATGPWMITNGNLTYHTFRNMEFRGVVLDGIDLRWAVFENCRFTNGAGLYAVDATGAQLNGVVIDDDGTCTGDFSNAFMISVRAGTHVNLEKANFSSALLEGCTLDETQLTGASFEGADLFSTTFAGANLVDAVFNRASLRDVRFTHANLTNVSFAFSKLDGATFKHAHTHGVRCTGAHGGPCVVELPVAGQTWQIVYSQVDDQVHVHTDQSSYQCTLAELDQLIDRMGGTPPLRAVATLLKTHATYTCAQQLVGA